MVYSSNSAKKQALEKVVARLKDQANSKPNCLEVYRTENIGQALHDAEFLAKVNDEFKPIINIPSPSLIPILPKRLRDELDAKSLTIHGQNVQNCCRCHKDFVDVNYKPQFGQAHRMFCNECIDILEIKGVLI